MMSYDIPTFPVEVTITSAHTAKAVRQELHNRLNALRDASEYLDVDISSHLQALQAFGRIEKAIADGKDDIGGMVITDDTIEYTLPGEGMRHLCVFPDDPSQRIAKRDAGKPEPDLSESDCFMLEAVWQNGGIRGGTDENPTITLSEEDFIKFVRGCQDHILNPSLNWEPASNQAGENDLWFVAVDKFGRKHEVIKSFHGQLGEGWSYGGTWFPSIDEAKGAAQTAALTANKEGGA